MNDNKLTEENKLKTTFDIEKKLDAKITIFTEAINKEISKQIDLWVKNINKSL